MYGYIYRITDLTNGKCYIGQHKYDKPMLDPKYHGSSRIIKNQIKKHPEHFLEEIIFIAATLEEANYFETYFIEHLNTLSPNGYNLDLGGKHGGGCKQSEETRKKKSQSFKGNTHGFRKGDDPYMKGKHHTEESKEKMRESSLKKWQNEEYRRHQSEAHKGKKQSEETIQKRAEKLRGRKASEETKAKISAIHTKYYFTEEQLYNLYVKDNLSAAYIARLLGCSHTIVERRLKKYKISK